jgi:hypothetical protein
MELNQKVVFEWCQQTNALIESNFPQNGVFRQLRTELAENATLQAQRDSFRVTRHPPEEC